MAISTVFVIKNGIKQGYCFWESLLSCLPFTDELIISDGFSNDGTFEALESFTNRYNSQVPIVLYKDDWNDKSYHGEIISKVTHRAMEKTTKDWILYLQADEVYHEYIGSYIKDISKSDYNSVYFPFYHFIRSWEPSRNAAYNVAIRMARRNQNPRLKGDGWTFDKIDPVAPSNLCPKPIYHFAWVFPKQNDVKDIEDANIYINFPDYQEKMKSACKLLKISKKPYPRTDFNDFPELSRRFVGKGEYTLP